MTAIVEPAEAGAARSRFRSLTDSLASLRSGKRLNITLENFFLTVGALCLPIGIVTIILGWYGAAHTGHVYEQNDYLISGGLLGLGLVFVGGFLYFGYWMTRQIRATETGNRQTLRALSRLEDKISGRAVTDAGSAGVLVVTEHGSMLHRPSCPAVAGQSVRVLDPTDTTSYKPCAICLGAE